MDSGISQNSEQALVESFVKAAIDEETDAEVSACGESPSSWVSLMTGYLEVDNDMLDLCPDKQTVDWYSQNFGRIHETNFGPIDRRISKRLGSGKEMPIDMRGNPLWQWSTFSYNHVVCSYQGCSLPWYVRTNLTFANVRPKALTGDYTVGGLAGVLERSLKYLLSSNF